MHIDNIDKAEILRVIDAVSGERAIPKSYLIETMQDALYAVASKQYGSEEGIIVKIDQNTGAMNIFKSREIVDIVNDRFTEIRLVDAQKIKQDAKIGENILEELPPMKIDRVSAQAFKKVILAKVEEVRRLSQYEDYKNCKGDILTGSVKRIEFGNVIVDIGRSEALLHRTQQIRGESFLPGDRIKAYVQDVRQEERGFQIFLSRTDDNFLAKLLSMEVPEIYNNSIEIKAIAREPGSKAKVVVVANDVSIEPIGACVGIRGTRIKTITNELSGEKIDIISWSDDITRYVINSIAPATVTKMLFDKDNKSVKLIIPDDQLSIAIGRKGQNVRLASNITEWNINVMSETQESQIRSEEFANVTNIFKDILKINETTAQLLFSEGYTTIDEIAYANPEHIQNIVGQESGQSIHEFALKYAEDKDDLIIESLEKLGVEQDLLDILDLPAEIILKLAESGIKSIEDLADISSDELSKLVPEIGLNKAEELVRITKENLEDSGE